VTGDGEHATVINEGALDSVRVLTAGHPGWMIAYHAGRDEYSATRPGLLLVRSSPSALDAEMTRWERA
jgi:hypothetical protein